MRSLIDREACLHKSISRRIINIYKIALLDTNFGLHFLGF